MLALIRSHLVGNAIGYLALFVALGGTSYAVATGSIDSREIKNNSVSSKDLRNNSVRGGDVRNRTITGRDVRAGAIGGAQVNEATLAKVPSAAAADRAGDAATLGGLGAGAFARANPAGTVVLANGDPERRVLTIAGRGELVVQSGGCDTTPPTAFDVAWRNTTGTPQDVWSQAADTDDPSLAPQYVSVAPQAIHGVALNEGQVAAATFLVRPTNRTDAATTIHLFATIGRTPNVCTVSAQAVLSG